MRRLLPPRFKVGFRQAALHLGALWAIGFVAPLFGLLGDSPQFFVARGNTASDIVVFGFAYALVPPLAAAAVIALLGRIRPALGWSVHLALIALLAAGFLLPPLGDALTGSAVAVVAALVVGALGALLYAHKDAVRTFLTLLSPAPVFFLVVFLLFSPVGELVRPDDAGGSAVGPSTSKTPIVQIVLDELPTTSLVGADGSIDAKLFPNLAKLAETATWYPNATTVAALTLEAVPSQLTGERPKRGDLGIAADHPGSLFTLFSRSHDMSVVEPLTDICPKDLCAEAKAGRGERLRALAEDLRIVAEHELLPADLRDDLPPIDQAWEGFGDAGEAPETAGPPQSPKDREGAQKKLLKRLGVSDAPAGFQRSMRALDAPRAKPPLIFLHSTLPHAPWRYLPDGRAYENHRDTAPGIRDGVWVGPQWLVDQSFQRHVLQMQYTDTLIGQLLDKVRAAGLFDDAVIVLTADHGASFESGQYRRELHEENLQDLIGVPFFVKLPGQTQGKVDDRAVRTIDVLPTIAKAAGTEVPWKIEGVPVDERKADPAQTIDFTHGEGDPFTRSLRDIQAGWQKRRSERTRLLRDGVERVGPRPDLLGRRVANETPPGMPHATVDAGGDFDDVHANGSVPALVTGDLTGIEPDDLLAVALNGRVVATTRAFDKDGDTQYSALLPPSELKSGPNRLAVLQVLPGDRLRTIGSAGAV